MRIFGREPAVLSALIASIIAVVGAFIFHLTDDQQTLLNVAVVAVFGLVTALGVAKDKLVPALLGLAQALLNVALGFGLDLSAEKQAILLTLVANLVAAVVVRPQVTAKVANSGLD